MTILFQPSNSKSSILKYPPPCLPPIFTVLHFFPSTFPLILSLCLSFSLTPLLPYFLLLLLLPMQETKTEYSHLEPLPELLEDNPYKELGDIEANDLLNFAYQIASGMVSHRVKGHCDQPNPSPLPHLPSLLLLPPSLLHVYRSIWPV